jgi:hypothetical protein
LIAMPETVMKGVSLYTRDRARSHDAFDLALDQLGIEIRRPGQSPRHLNWERITEWEITQRRGGVLLILRGDGAATPLIIPNWRVDQLDQVLREVTASVPPPPPEAYDEAFPLESEYRAPARAGSTAPGPVDLHDDLEDGDVEGTLVWPNHSPLNSLPNLTWPEDGIDRDALSRVDLDFAGESAAPERPPFDAVAEAAAIAARAEAAAEAAEKSSPSSSGLPPASEWSAKATEVPEDDIHRAFETADDLIASEFSWSMKEVDRSEPLTWAGEEERRGPPPGPRTGPPTAAVPAVRVPPVEGNAEPAVPRADRRRQSKPKGSWRRFFGGTSMLTVGLLGALATAVALVLAQSAGAIHFGFLGSAG